MKKIIICFDIDGTLLDNDNSIGKEYYQGNDRIMDLLKILSSFKNTKIIVWSGQGKEYTKYISKELGLEKYINGYASKNHKGKDKNGKHIFEPEFVPDICFDDIQACELGLINLICKEK